MWSAAAVIGALRVKIQAAITFQLDHKSFNKTCVTSKDSDQHVHPPSIARVLVHPSLDSPEVVEGTCNQQRL